MPYNGQIAGEVIFEKSFFPCIAILGWSEKYRPWMLANTLFFAALVRGRVRKFCHRCYDFVNRNNGLMYYTLIERATVLLYNYVDIMHERNKYFEIDVLKDTWGKITGTFV